MISESPERDWLTGKSEHEGYPIFFRRPDVAVSEYLVLSQMYPVLVVGTLQLTKLQDNGLPEAAYNHSLADLDFAITDAVRSSGAGIVALVETFAAKRTFYLYVTPTFDIPYFTDSLSVSFPETIIAWEHQPDPTWKLLSGYAMEFGFA